MAYLDIVVTKYEQDLNVENQKAVMTEIKDPNKWKDILCS